MWKRYLIVGATVCMLAGVSTVSRAETVSGGEPVRTEGEAQTEFQNEMPAAEKASVYGVEISAEGASGKYVPYEGAKYSLTYEIRDYKVTITGITDYKSKSDLGYLVIPREMLVVSPNDPNLLVSAFVTKIGGGAFYGCSGFVHNLEIPDTVTTIEDYAFYGCSHLDHLTMPNSVTKIGVGAFEGCSHLFMWSELVVPNGVTVIEARAFYGCSGWGGSLVIPDSVTTIGNSAFYGCSGFNGSLVIPDSVTTIGNSAFYGCNGLKGNLNIPKGVAVIGKGVFSGCSGFTGNLTIPEGVTTIGDEAFSGCSGFTGNLIIPEGVTTIGKRVFNGCSGFTGNLVIPSEVTTIGDGAFSGCSGLTGNLVIPSEVTIIGDGAFGGCIGFSGNLVIPSEVTIIGNRAFSGCSGLTGDLVIPEGVTAIGAGAFEDCSGFTGNLVIPNSVTTIGDYAFENCSGFTGNLVIPNSVATIWNGVFYNCSGFTGKLVIPDSVTEIGKEAFYGCNGIESITILGKQTEIPDGLDIVFVRAYSDSVVAREASKSNYNTFIPIDAPEVTEYRVATVQELDSVLWTAREDSYWRIILADGVYNLGEYDTSIALNRRVSVALEAEHPGRAEIVAQDASKPVISVNQCADIKIAGCILGYTSGQTAAAKDLVQIRNSMGVQVKLYGQSVTTGTVGTDTNLFVSMMAEEQKNFVDGLAAREGIIGEEATVEITVSGAEDTLTEQEKSKVVQAVAEGGLQIGRYLDISMSLQAGESTRKITHTDTPVRLVIDVPPALRQTNMAFFVIRLHDGKVDLLRDLDSDPDTVTIETDYFSSYTIVYREKTSSDSVISGTVKSFGDASQGALVQLLDGDGNVIAQTTAAAGSSGTYELESAAPGGYVLQVSKAGHVTRSYEVTLDGESLELNAEIRLKGDVNGDGKADSLDKRMIFGHIAGSTTLTGYEFQVGDVDGSGRIDALDKRMIYGHIAGTSPMW